MIACCVSPARGQFKEGSIGCPVSDVVVRIGDLETGEGSLKPGETGELVMKAPQLMQGYLNRPEETREMLRDGWLYTGDIGHMDEDGYVFITSRKKTSSSPAASRCGRARWRRSSVPIRQCPRCAWPVYRTLSRAKQ